MNVFKAKDLPEALELIAGGAKPMAGCTNIYVNLKKDGQPDCDFADITEIGQLKGIVKDKDSVRIGALVTFAELEKAFKDEAGMGALFNASDMGSPQIRNRATIGGNICDASPSCDAGPALLVLDAKVKLVSREGERTVGIDEFFKGVRKTEVRADELMTEIIVPVSGRLSGFRKVGLRNAMAISVVSLAVKQKQDGGVRLAMGAVADRPVRLYECEKLAGQKNICKAELKKALEKDIHPISDIRASREYRAETAFNLLVDMLGKEYGYEFI